MSIPYVQLLSEIKQRVRAAQAKAALAVNRELVLLYWNIGRTILSRQKRLGWGARIIDRLAQDLKRSFPEMRGFSSRNLKYMRAFAEAYPSESFVQQAVAQIPWGHHVRLLDRIKASSERRWYIHKTIECGWSRDVLIHQIESRLYQRQADPITNFQKTLPPPESDIARQTLKDPYNFDFLTMTGGLVEKRLEQGLLDHLQSFLVELGVGFAFVGRQVHLAIGDEDFYIDLLFYHLRLRCFIVIELKVGKFKPEHAGKMNFYLSAVDDRLRHPDDRPSIGLVLCKTRNRIVAEYTLRDLAKPISVSGYRLTETLPKKLKRSLPSIKKLETELREDFKG